MTTCQRAAARTSGFSARICARRDAHFLSPFDGDAVIEGQASVGVEIHDQLGRSPDIVVLLLLLVLPVGGGGLAAGVTQFLHRAAPATAFRFVEPSGRASLTAALQQGQTVQLPRVKSFVDGAEVAQMGARPFAALNGINPAHVLLAPEDRICVTMPEMLNVGGIVLAPAGAMAVAVLPELAAQIAGQTIVCAKSGGNVGCERLPEVKERAKRFAGPKKYFILRMPQRPGALREFLATPGPRG